MIYSYIILFPVNPDPADGSGVSPALQLALARTGMNTSHVCGSATVYATDETPIIRVPDGGMILGHLFSESGVRVVDANQFPKNLDPAAFKQHLLRNFWGEYILLQPETRGTAAITVMRDPSGGVRCIYHIGQRSGFVTSDISLATRLGLFEQQVDWSFVPSCLVYPHLKSERSATLGVRELLPGCSICIRGTSVTPMLDWSPWDFVTAGDRPETLSDAEADLRRAISMAVRAWGETDRTVLLELSGGLDSSIVAACLLASDVNVHCCNITTPVPGADERQYARLMADLLGVDLQITELGFDDAKFEFVPPAYLVTPRVWMLQYSADRAKSAVGDALDVTSYFSGGGGDSVFSYLSNATPAADALLANGLRSGITAIKDLARLHQCTIWKAARLTLRKLLRAPKAPVTPNETFLTEAGKACPPAEHPWFTVPTGVLPGDRERVHELVNTQNFRDGNPRTANRWMRMPLLSQPVVECCLRVPSWMWISSGRNRSVARSAFTDLLPPDILNRRSKGTYVNFTGSVFRRSKREILNFLLTGELEAHGLVDTNALYRIHQQAFPFREESFMRLFELCMIENWVRHHSRPSSRRAPRDASHLN
jgi:asparagine synthase (glutamine-hydrolysing)